MKYILRRSLIGILLIFCLILCSCAGNSKNNKKSEATVEISEDEKFGAAQMLLSKEEFEEHGFQLGDSCNIEFENGYKLEDVPYYDGYYVKNGDPLIVAYPGRATVNITYNQSGIWADAQLKNGEKVTVTLNEKGKYLAIQEALGQSYSSDINLYADEVEFCNFRTLTGGNLKENFLFRGASPVDNSHGRAYYVDTLINEQGIKYIIDLADSQANIDEYMAAEDFDSPYAKSLLEDEKVSLLDMNSNYYSVEYKQKVVTGLRGLLQAGEGPVYIHCMEGKDRTGFVCTLIEALAGASYEEMLADYMITYRNYYQVSSEGTPEKYQAIAELYFDAFMETIALSKDKAEWTDSNLNEGAVRYLSDGGMSEEEIQSLITFITK